jgi:hypothetical protein
LHAPHEHRGEGGRREGEENTAWGRHRDKENNRENGGQDKKSAQGQRKAQRHNGSEQAGY